MSFSVSLERFSFNCRKVIGHFRVPLCLRFKARWENQTYVNDFDLHENETAYWSHFHLKGLALRLVLKQRHKRTRKWPIGTKSNRDSVALAFPRFLQVTWMLLLWVLIGSLDWLCPLWLARVITLVLVLKEKYEQSNVEPRNSRTLRYDTIRYDSIQYNTNFIVNFPWGLFRKY